MKDLKTSEEWSKEIPNVKVLDPDGWDRTNYQYSWYEELIPLEEYYARITQSTCQIIINPENKKK